MYMNFTHPFLFRNIPTEPEDLADVNIEDLVAENLVNNEKKLELLDEKNMGEGMCMYIIVQECISFIVSFF